MCPEEQPSLGRFIKYGKSDFCFISIFIRKGNEDNAMYPSSYQSKRTLGEVRVAKVKQVVVSVSSFYLFCHFYSDEILLTAISKETNSFASAWKSGDSNEHKEMFVE